MKGLIEACDLIQRETPERDYMLGNLIYGQCLGMLYGHTGIGKTWFSLLLATCLAGGSRFFKYEPQKPRKVAYIDGEMLVDSIRERVINIMASASFDIEPGYLNFVAPDLFESSIVPNIASPEGQAWYNQNLADREVIIIDNLMSCSSRIGREDDTQTWARIQAWLVGWRVKRKAVILVHHSGKSGAQLGTSVREQVMDWILHLRRPFDYSPEDGASFICSFDKGRNLSGDDATDFSVSLKTNREGLVEWKWNPSEDCNLIAVKRAVDLGMKDRDICHATGLSLFMVKQLSQKLGDKGGSWHGD